MPNGEIVDLDFSFSYNSVVPVWRRRRYSSVGKCPAAPAAPLSGNLNRIFSQEII